MRGNVWAHRPPPAPSDGCHLGFHFEIRINNEFFTFAENCCLKTICILLKYAINVQVEHDCFHYTRHTGQGEAYEKKKK